MLTTITIPPLLYANFLQIYWQLVVCASFLVPPTTSSSTENTCFLEGENLHSLATHSCSMSLSLLRLHTPSLLNHVYPIFSSFLLLLLWSATFPQPPTPSTSVAPPTPAAFLRRLRLAKAFFLSLTWEIHAAAAATDKGGKGLVDVVMREGGDWWT